MGWPRLATLALHAAAGASRRARLRRRRQARSRDRRGPRRQRPGVRRAGPRRRHVLAGVERRHVPRRLADRRWRSTTSTATARSTSRSARNRARVQRHPDAARRRRRVVPPPTNRSIVDALWRLPRFAIGDQTGDGLPEHPRPRRQRGHVLSSRWAALAFERRLDLTTQKAVEHVVTADVDSRRSSRSRLLRSTSRSRSALQLGNGDGTFRVTTDVSTAIFVDQLGAGDVDRDGDVDLVVASANEIGVLLGAGNGTFLPGALRPIDSFTELAPGRGRHRRRRRGRDRDSRRHRSARDVRVARRRHARSWSAERRRRRAERDGDRRLRPRRTRSTSRWRTSAATTCRSCSGSGAAPSLRRCATRWPISRSRSPRPISISTATSTWSSPAGRPPCRRAGPNAMVLLGDGHGAFVPLPRFTPATVARARRRDRRRCGRVARSRAAAREHQRSLDSPRARATGRSSPRSARGPVKARWVWRSPISTATGSRTSSPPTREAVVPGCRCFYTDREARSFTGSRSGLAASSMGAFAVADARRLLVKVAVS